MRRRDWVTGLLIALLVGGVMSLFADRLSGLSLDCLFWLRERLVPEAVTPEASPSVIVEIDEETYRRPPFINVPNALWTHEIASVLDALVAADAKVIGFDVIFPTSMDRYVPGFDRPFLTALKHGADAGKIVLGEVQLQLSPIHPFPAQGFAVGGDKNIRFLNLIPDDDSVIRRAPLRFAHNSSGDSGPRDEPSFAAEIAARVGGEHTVPNAGTDQFLLNFHGLDAIPSYSLADLVACNAAGKQDFFRAHFAGKAVLFGVVLDVEDRKLTSLRLATKPEHGATGERCALPPLPNLFRDDISHTAIPGTYVIATAINNLLQGDALASLSRIVTTAIILMAALAAALAGLVWRPFVAALAALVAALIWTVAATIAFRHDLVLSLLSPPIAAAASLALLIGYRFGVADRDKRLLRRSFGFYLAPALIDRMIATEKLPELGGETREVTILMSDLAGFTQMAEPLSPHRLVAIINAYFTAMAAIIEEEGGFIQDYAGDALLAIFGAPFDDPEHARHAAQAALRCSEKLAALTQSDPVLGGYSLRARIGLNTGEVLVGNIGSTQRLKYTAMGDTVNLAARLETINKTYGTTILASGPTQHVAGGGIVWREVDRVRVVGRDHPVELWEPLGNSESVPSDAATDFAQALAVYRAGNFANAEPLFAALAETDPPARLFLQRLSDFARHPPQDWDGITNLDVK